MNTRQKRTKPSLEKRIIADSEAQLEISSRVRRCADSPSRSRHARTRDAREGVFRVVIQRREIYKPNFLLVTSLVTESQFRLTFIKNPRNVC